MSLIPKMPGRILVCPLIMLIISIILTAGCISITESGQPYMEGESPDIGMPTATSGAHGDSPPSLQQREVHSTVRDADPIQRGPDVPTRLRSSIAPDYPAPSQLGTLFHERRHIVYSNYAYLVDAKSPPLIIELKVKPDNTNPRLSYFIVTVSDSESGDVYAKGGYGGIYPTQEEQRLAVYREGEYHINIEARNIHVDFKILTADAPLEAVTVEQAYDPFYLLWGK